MTEVGAPGCESRLLMPSAIVGPPKKPGHRVGTGTDHAERAERAECDVGGDVRRRLVHRQGFVRRRSIDVRRCGGGLACRRVRASLSTGVEPNPLDASNPGAVTAMRAIVGRLETDGS